MTGRLFVSYRTRSLRRQVNYLRAVWRNTKALLFEFRRSMLAGLLVTMVGGLVYGELYQAAGHGVIPLLSRPYVMVQLMILQTPGDPPPEWYLLLFWYALPLIFVFIVGNGVVDFVRLFFDRSGEQAGWRRALVSTFRKHVIVFGAGHVGLRVIRLLRNLDVEVVAIDNHPDPGVKEELSKMRVPLLTGDGTEAATLEEAGLQYADAFVACTGRDQVNLLAIMQVRDMRPNIRIVSRVWDEWYATKMTRMMNVEGTLSASDLAAPAFAGMALGVEITHSMHVDQVDYGTCRLVVNTQSFMEGMTIGDLQRKFDMDIVLHARNGSVNVQPAHDLKAKSGDTLVIFARHERLLEIATRNRYPK